jgi:hypothetical protein
MRRKEGQWRGHGEERTGHERLGSQLTALHALGPAGTALREQALDSGRALKRRLRGRGGDGLRLGNHGPSRIGTFPRLLEYLQRLRHGKVSALEHCRFENQKNCKVTGT